MLWETVKENTHLNSEIQELNESPILVASLGPKLVWNAWLSKQYRYSVMFLSHFGRICGRFAVVLQIQQVEFVSKWELFDVSCGGLNRYCFCRLYVPLTTRRGRDCCSLWPAPVVCLLAASPSSWVCSFRTVLFSKEVRKIIVFLVTLVTLGHEMKTGLPDFRILIVPCLDK